MRPTPSAEDPERPNFAFDVDPGEVLEDSIRVRSYSDRPLHLDVYASDALTTPSGDLDLLPTGVEPTGVGAWISLGRDAITVPPGGIVDVPFTLSIPSGAEPGDHSGGIVTTYRAPSADGDGEPVVLEHRLGSRVHVRVAGRLEPMLEVTDLSVDWAGTPNPLGTGRLRVRYTVANVGNVRAGATQDVAVPGRLGFPGRRASPPAITELLPGSTLDVAVEVPAVWPTVRTAARVEVTPVEVRPGDVFDPAPPVARASAAVWAVPWSLLVVVVLLVLAVLWVRANRRRRRRRDAARVERAVQEALAERGATGALSPAQTGNDGRP